MIKKLANWSVLVFMLVAGTAAAELKIAVLDTQRALVESEEAKQLLADAEKALREEQQEVQTLREEIEALQERLQKDGEVMSPVEQRKAQKDIEDKGLDYQFLANKLQKEVQDVQEDILQQMGPKINKVLSDLIEIEGYDLIMERQTLRYVNSKHDIARKVTEKLNENRQ